MRLPLPWLTIRARLFVAYVGILVLGFGVLTLVAGGQISSAAREDYERRLLNEIRLIAQGIKPYFADVEPDAVDMQQVETTLAAYGAQVGGTITLYRPGQAPASFYSMPELETALRGGVVVVERRNEQGQPTLFTGALVMDYRRNGALVQLSVPFDNLQRLMLERWLALLVIVGVIAAVATAATVWVSRSIVGPLYKLRESAVKLSQGDLSHRVDYTRKDEIGEVAAAFNEMSDEVQSMLEEQRAFASNTSHELRTPLTTIRLRTEALRYDGQLDPATARQYIADIDDEVIRLGALIEDLTLLSRFDAGRAELGNTEVDAGRLAASLQHQMSALARTRGILLDFQSPPEPVVLRASMNHLNVALRNVLDNAIKYTPDGGQVKWRLTAISTGAQFNVEDTGQGILPEHLPHLFERFYRADRSRSRSVPGTGLGLALVKSILDAYGGSINIHSDGRGKGTRVTIFWPCRTTPSHL